MEGSGGLAVRTQTAQLASGKGGKVSGSSRPVAIDLFAGVGGLSLGFEQAGFDVVGAVEIDPVHAAVHHFNFPKCKVIPKSVSNLTGDEIRTLIGMGNREIDAVFGGAPCQGFSLIGHRAMDDPRNGLVTDFVRLVRELNPRFAVFENVKGLTVGKHRGFLLELIEALNTAGYRVRTPWRVLDAADWGVPQHRERLILLAARVGLPLPEYPSETHYSADALAIKGLERGPTCRDAIDDLPDVDEFDALKHGDEVPVTVWRPRTEYARQMHCTDGESWFFGYRRIWDPKRLTASARTEHTDISKRRFRATQAGDVEPISRFLKLDPNGLCNTLRAGTDSARGAFTSPRPIHYRHSRCVTVREMARLHGFPDWFRFHATKWHGARQIGNSVAPPLARAIAQELLRALGRKPARPARPLGLGDENLLRMDVTSAAAFFGIVNPIGKRNLKSGARKRKQSEIEAGLSGV